MVVAARIAYVRKLLEFGAKVSCSISFNPTTQVEKVRLLIDPTVHIDADWQVGAAIALDYLECASVHARIADRGHRHSSGISEVVFLITRAVEVLHNPSRLTSGPTAQVPVPDVGAVPASALGEDSFEDGGPSGPVLAAGPHPPPEAPAFPAFDPLVLVASWQELPNPAWNVVYSRFDSFRWRPAGDANEVLPNSRFLGGGELQDPSFDGMILEVRPSLQEAIVRSGFMFSYMRAVREPDRTYLYIGYSGYGDRSDHQTVKHEVHKMIADAMAIRGLVAFSVLVLQDNGR
jgi:hypothetical protein